MTPDFIVQIIQREQLTVDRIMRNGPRYWVALVHHADGRQLILKVVIKDSTWASPGSGRQFRTSDQLRAEILALRELGGLVDDIAGDIPQLLDSDTNDPVWTLREQVAGQDMSGSDGSLIYRSEFYDLVQPEALVEYILSYQRLTPRLRELAAATPHTDQTDMHSKMIIADLDYPQNLLTPYSKSVNDFLRAEAGWHDEQITVLAHGEVFPPHIFVQDGSLLLIDWENFGLSNPLSDLMQVWIRTFDRPDWRQRFKDAIWQKSDMAPSALERLWQIEKLYQSSRNLNYLDHSTIESQSQMKAAAASFSDNITEVLR